VSEHDHDGAQRLYSLTIYLPSIVVREVDLVLYDKVTTIEFGKEASHTVGNVNYQRNHESRVDRRVKSKAYLDSTEPIDHQVKGRLSLVE
jgi:hypothetical protein